MPCPNCSEQMATITCDNQAVLHCTACGCSFFEENGINRITVSSAEKLSKDKKSEFIVGKSKYCPKDKAELMPVQNSSAIPHDVTLLQCSTCKGIFVYPDDLFSFKNAQSVKIDFFKSWRVPLPSLSAVLVFTFLLFVSISLISGISTLNNKSIQQSQAYDVIKKVVFYESGKYLLVSFQSELPLASTIIFYDNEGKALEEKIISEKPNKLHRATLTGASIDEAVSYSLKLTDEKGNKIETEKKMIEIGK